MSTRSSELINDAGNLPDKNFIQIYYLNIINFNLITLFVLGKSLQIKLVVSR